MKSGIACRGLSTLLVVVLSGIAAAAQDTRNNPAKGTPPKKKSKVPAFPKSKPKTPAGKQPKKKAVAQWEKLNARRKEIARQLKELQAEFSVSSRSDKLRIKRKFETLLKEWKDDVEPKMVEVSLAQLTQNPDDDLASQLAEELPDQTQVVAVTERLLKQGKETGPVLRLAGKANFNVNNFERAVELLTKARDKDTQINDLFLDQAKDYVGYWKRELQLRKKEASLPPENMLPRVKIETEKGDIVLELFEDQAPNTVANFISLAEKKDKDKESGYFDGQHFFAAHVEAGIAAGDPNTKPKFDPQRQYGFGGPGYTIKSEWDRDDARMHFAYTVTMHNFQKDKDGSQFIITRRPVPEFNPSPGGLRGHTVFGRVIKGQDVVDQIKRGDKIIKVTVLHKRDHEYKPKTSNDPDEPAPKTKKAPPFPGKKTTKKPKPKTGKTKTPPPPKTSNEKPDKTPKKKAPDKTPSKKPAK